MAAGIYMIETNFVRHPFAKGVEHGAHIVLDLLRGVNDQIAGTTQHTERGKQTWQAETVVAMQVGDEYMVQPAEFDTHVTHLHLSAFTTVYHI